ncbi:PREDICTED: serine/arginine repetitive matrix protein 1-like [Hipposideros armiger]|uniref:Serine/arginine repetitive matrix protein 1-like n=1 Tax=Hipposideros armiger TaxID=186990 RepID=A0A8B7Q3Q9_HIPAR|nr:PREDICTED: serine/arginine repetitive matrix protein 1-like [Hipposideros armiger]
MGHKRRNLRHASPPRPARPAPPTPPSNAFRLLPRAGSPTPDSYLARVRKQRAHSRSSREPRKPWSPPEARDRETPLPEPNSNCPPGPGAAQAHLGALGTLAETAIGAASSGATAGRARGHDWGGEKARLGRLCCKKAARSGALPTPCRHGSSQSPNPDRRPARSQMLRGSNGELQRLKRLSPCLSWRRERSNENK